MYLHTLDIEKKHLFLDLELYMVKADGVFNDLEKEIINSHCLEMRIDNNHFQTETDWETLITRLAQELSSLEKRIFLLEIIGVIFADNEYSEEERSLLKEISTSMGFSEKDETIVLKIMEQLRTSYEACKNFVFEGIENG